MTKRLYKSQTNKVIAGVMGGIGEYFDVDPVLIRLLYVIATVFTGVVPGIIGYILAMIIVPRGADFVVTPSAPADASKDA